MIQKDFIMRQIQQFVQVLAKVLFFKSQSLYEEARDEIHQAFFGILGRGPAEIAALDDEALLDLSSTSDGLNTEFALALADLFYEEGQMVEDEGSTTQYFQRALFLYEEVVLKNKTIPLHAHDKIAEIREALTRILSSK